MKSLFTWLVATPFLYYLLALSVLLGFCVLAAVNREVKTGKLGAEWLFLTLAAGTLLVWRMPVMLWPEPMNIDEGEFAACAIRATRDFAPWRGFDASTSGPLNCYILMIPILFGGQITFFATRVIAFFLITLAIYALYFAAKWTLGSTTARLAIVPPIALLALTDEPEFLHCSSEYFPIFLTSVGIAAGVYLAAHWPATKARLWACLIAGLCLGSAPFAKLQSLPIAVAGVVLIVGVVFLSRGNSKRDKWTDLVALMVGLSITPGIIGISLASTGEWHYAIISYVKSSAHYVESGTTAGLNFLFGTVTTYRIFVISSLLVIAAGIIALRGRWSFSLHNTAIFSCAVGFLLVSLFAVYAARRAFPHYLLFTVLPLSFCVATILYSTRKASLWKGREVLLSGLVVALFVVPALRQIAGGRNPFLDRKRNLVGRERHEEGYISPFLCLRKSGPVVKAISRYARAGSAVAIWGWMPHYHVQAQTIMATRDATAQHQLVPGPYREFFCKRFMSDIRATRPPVFVDAVAPGSWAYTNRATYGYESFPALAAFIRENYQLTEDVEGVRIFVAEEFTNK